MIKNFFCSLLLIFVLTACNVSFPKETLEQDAVNLIKQETQKDVSVFKVGSTLYLDVCFEDLVTNDTEKITKIYETLQKIVSNIVRVPLSSDANINFVVVSAFDPKYQTMLRLFENIDDIKLYSHQYISREDYSERQLMEFEGPKFTKEVIDNKYDLTKEEYVARLIISQLNIASRTNPFLATLIQTLDLKFLNIENNVIYYTASRKIDNKEIKILLKSMLEKEVIKNIKKYKLFSIKSAILKDGENNIVLDVPVNI
ncbi:MAG: hypothetical protein II669_02305 [Elusimicrobia bacterium]|nr:hypothetical protein [Elusimicrobiota bacterium]